MQAEKIQVQSTELLFNLTHFMKSHILVISSRTSLFCENMTSYAYRHQICCWWCFHFHQICVLCLI